MIFDILTKWHCDKNCTCCKYMRLYSNNLLELLPPEGCMCTLWAGEGILRSLKMRCPLIAWQSYQNLCKAHLLLGMSTHIRSDQLIFIINKPESIHVWMCYKSGTSDRHPNILKWEVAKYCSTGVHRFSKNVGAT